MSVGRASSSRCRAVLIRFPHFFPPPSSCYDDDDDDDVGDDGDNGESEKAAWNPNVPLIQTVTLQATPTAGTPLSYYMLKLPEAVPVLTIIKLYSDAILPTKATLAAVGFDLYALEDSEIPSWSIRTLRTGIRATPPCGHYLRLTGRSGLTSQGFLVQSGVVDPDYTGELLVVALNATNFKLNVKRGNRIAQMVPEKYASNCTSVVMELSQVESQDRVELASGSRGLRGFGSSGI